MLAEKLNQCYKPCPWNSQKWKTENIIRPNRVKQLHATITHTQRHTGNVEWWIGLRIEASEMMIIRMIIIIILIIIIMMIKWNWEFRFREWKNEKWEWELEHNRSWKRIGEKREKSMRSKPRTLHANTRMQNEWERERERERRVKKNKTERERERVKEKEKPTSEDMMKWTSKFQFLSLYPIPNSFICLLWNMNEIIC